ncbi:MAG: hypothetical protein ABI883_06880, partial [Chthoniobacterales bacterium]
SPPFHRDVITSGGNNVTETGKLDRPGRRGLTLTALPEWGWYLILAIVAILYHVVFLQINAQWWFEDDPTLFAFVKKVANPMAFFLSPETLKSYGAGGSLTPFQALSEWIDSTVAYRSLTFVHLHNTLSLTITLLILFHVLRRFRLSIGAAISLCLLWLCLPGTIVVSQFLAARHYLEGFAVALLAVAFAQRVAQGDWAENWRSVSLLCVTLACAMLCKEIYAITLPLFVAIYLFEVGRRGAALAALLLVPPYLAYRYWIFGGGVTWGSPFLGPVEYVTYLWRLPFALTGSYGGYLLAGVGLIVVWWFVVRGSVPLRMWAYGLLLLGSILAVMYPVAYPTLSAWESPKTWHRVLFLLGTALLLGAGFAYRKLPQGFSRRVGLALTIVVLGWGAVVTQQEWRELMAGYRREGRFYLAHPDRLLYSEVPASFFLGGVDQLYEVPERHYVLAAERVHPPRDVLQRHGTIWRVVEGKFKRDPALFAELQGKAELP